MTYSQANVSGDVNSRRNGDVQRVPALSGTRIGQPQPRLHATCGASIPNWTSWRLIGQVSGSLPPAGGGPDVQNGACVDGTLDCVASGRPDNRRRPGWVGKCKDGCSRRRRFYAMSTGKALSQVRNRRRSGAHLRSRLRHPGLQVRRCLRSSDWHRLHPKGGCSVRIRRQRRARQRETLDELPSVLDAPTLPDIRFAVVGLSLSALGLRTSCRARRATWQRSSVRGATPESPWARGCRLRCPPFPMRVSEWKGSTTEASKGPRNRAHPPWVRRG